MTNQELFTEAWKIARLAHKNFNYYGGAKQYFSEALKLAYAGYTSNDIMYTKALFSAQRLADADVTSCKNLNGYYFLLNTNKGQFIYCTARNVLFPDIDESVTLEWNTEIMPYKQDLPLLTAIQELNRFKPENEANIVFNIN